MILPMGARTDLRKIGGNMSYFDDVFEPSLYRTPRFARDSVPKRTVDSLRKGIWHMRDGTTIRMTDMSDSHLRNAFNMVRRIARNETDRVAIEMLGKEIERRKGLQNDTYPSERRGQDSHAH